MAATTMSLGLLAGPAGAAGSRTVSGPATGDDDVYLTYVRCDDLFGSAVAPQSRINLGPYAAPLGRRSLGLVPAAGGSAAGPYATIESLADVDASVSVAATGGGRGVSWILAVTQASPVGTAWRGRATVSVPAGSWQQVSASELTYTWTLVDLATGAALDAAGTATPAAFAAEHGDGAGFVVTGLGCDGKAFNLDAVRSSGTTLDFEGVTLTSTIAAGRQQVAVGDEVEITGRVTDGAGRLTGDSLVLEQRVPGAGWSPVGRPVLAGRDGVARVSVPVAETTEFRWHRPEGQYADEGWSQTVTVTATQPAQPDQSNQSGQSGQPDQSEAPAQQ
ncbi:hypothetical protein F4692_003132 [Nocardioides cavernae]|uniref:Uncharacterized protein n=1 Tax=Nocardioides cavernae TaxID=1921566 RepID=A0A7Y9H4V9_9ACTN|nr:hypothetical protein [Nocardioides cavernae]NYE37987.1 hypothetical protein [Nocardioides cavernae]